MRASHLVSFRESTGSLMDNDRAISAFDLPGGARNAEPVETPIDLELDDGDGAWTAPDVEIDAGSDRAFDAAVFRVLEEANATRDDGDVPSRSELLPDDDLSPVSERISSETARTGRKRLSSAALVSVLFHSVVFAAAIHMARTIPEPPQEAGSVTVSVVSIGNGDVDALAEGNEDMVANPVEVEAEPVEAEPITAATAVEQAEAPSVSEAEPLQPQTTETATLEEPVAVAPTPEPEVLSVAPTAEEIPQSVAPAAATVQPEMAEPVESAAVSAAEPVSDALEPPEPEASTAVSATEPIEAERPETETIRAQEDNPEVALDIEAPVPQPSPWRSEPVPQDQVETRQAAQRQQQRERQVRQQRRETAAGAGGNASANAARGASTGTSQSGSSSGAEATARASDNGAAAMANYAGKVGSRIRRSVGNSRYYRGVGRLSTTVTVNVTVSRSGQIAGVSLARSSGNGQVDSIVIQRARAAGPFGAFPSSYRGSSHSFSLPIRLNLR